MTSSNQFAPFSETAENEEVCCGAGWVDQTRWGTARSQMGAAGAQRAPLGETGWLVGRRAFWPCLGAANGAHPDVGQLRLCCTSCSTGASLTLASYPVSLAFGPLSRATARMSQ